MAKKYKRRKNQIRLTKNQAIALAVIFLIIIVVGVFLYKKGYISFGENGSSSSSSSSSGPIIQTDELSIHFPMLGNKSSGDCILIDVGDTEVLVDAGSEQNSAETIKTYVDQYCTDGKLEYVIATHADQDHIAAFVGLSNKGAYNGILYSYDVGTIIKFPRTGKSTTTASGNPSLYGKFLTAIDYAVGNGANVYTALECWNAGVNSTGGPSRSFTLAENVTLNILYQRFYEENTSDENDYSVCFLLKQGNNNYLFTGDLEGAGEASLIANNTLPEVELFKAGHHGSPTSSSAALMNIIKPKNVVVCCCCGNHKEYNFSSMDVVFPSQAFVDHVAPWTENIYIPTLYDEEKDSFLPMNGNIVFTSSGGELNLWCSNNTTKFKDTAWFSQYREWNTGS